MTIRLLDGQGDVLTVAQQLEQARSGQRLWRVSVPYDGAEVQATLVAIPLPAREVAKAKAKVRKKRKKKGKEATELSLGCCEFTWLLTTLDVELFPPAVLGYLYRLRWQIELFFKRCKSLVGMGELKDSKDEMSEVEVLAQILLVLVVQTMTNQMVDEKDRPRVMWRATHLMYIAIVSALAGPELLAFLLDERDTLVPKLKESPRRRKFAMRLFSRHIATALFSPMAREPSLI